MSDTPTPPTSLLAALAAVQAAMPALPLDKKNPHFNSKFTGLETMVEKAGPLLAQHGLVWTTLPGRDGFGMHLEYRLIHVETGEAIVGFLPLLVSKTDMQGLGGALTYARRYALAAVLNLVSDEDVDGNNASGYGQPQNTNTLMSVARGLDDAALAHAYKQAGMDPPEKPFVALNQIPPGKQEAMRSALMAAHHAR